MQYIVIFEQKVDARRGDDDAGASLAPDCNVAVVLLTEAEMSPVTSLSHAAMVDQPEVDVDLVGAGSPSIGNAFSHSPIIIVVLEEQALM